MNVINITQIVNFTTNGSSETIDIHIPIVDDGHIGTRRVLICALELVDTSLSTIVNISTPYAVVIIGDTPAIQGKSPLLIIYSRCSAYICA